MIKITITGSKMFMKTATESFHHFLPPNLGYKVNLIVMIDNSKHQTTRTNVQTDHH